MHEVAWTAVKCTFGYIILCTGISKKGGTGGGEWGYLQAERHVMALVAGCRNGLVGSMWANSCLCGFSLMLRVTVVCDLNQTLRVNSL